MKHRVSQSVGKFFHRIIPVFLLTLIACGGDDAPSGSSGSSPSVVYMWVSTQNTNGNIGGVNGATTICETDASTSAPIAGLTHRAVIATSSNDPRDYFSNNPPVQRPDATVITDAYADFFDSTIIATNSVSSSYSGYWTGITTSGTPSNVNCTNWTAVGAGTQGVPGGSISTDKDRFNTGSGDPCTDLFRLLCVSY